MQLNLVLSFFFVFVLCYSIFYVAGEWLLVLLDLVLCISLGLLYIFLWLFLLVSILY